MLKVTIPEKEFFDEEKEEFVKQEAKELRLEHSLASISKWEERHHKPFLGGELSYEETLDYIACMSEKEVDTFVLRGLTVQSIDLINKYIEDPMTGTTFGSEPARKARREVITAEIIYYWMFSLNIPLEWEHRHFNKLMTLIKVCSIKNSPPKKMGKKGTAKWAKELNDARRTKLKTKG
ncbi:MAG: hypothetical protein NC078_06345 [Ruminococcus sp.]|nr:hypothetical protein [Ruminococcus sp.]